MNTKLSCIALLLLIPLGGGKKASTSAEPNAVHWAGKTVAFEKLPADFPASVKELINHYQEYAIEQNLRVQGEPNSPVVFWTAGSVEETTKLLKLAQKFFLNLRKAFGGEESASVPVFLLKKTAQYAPLISLLVKDHPYLEPWAETARSISGFQLYKPPILVLLNDGVEQEEYSLENQMLHQLTHLFLGLQFGPQPFWLSEGLAWHFEEQLQSSVYAYCYRSGFIYTAEHTSWEKDLQKMFQKQKQPKFEELFAAKKEDFDMDRALTSFGVARFLANEKSQALRLFLMEYQREHKSKYEAEPTRELDSSWQAARLKERLGEDFETQIARYITKGKK